MDQLEFHPIVCREVPLYWKFDSKIAETLVTILLLFSLLLCKIGCLLDDIVLEEIYLCVEEKEDEIKRGK